MLAENNLQYKSRICNLHENNINSPLLKCDNSSLVSSYSIFFTDTEDTKELSSIEVVYPVSNSQDLDES